MLLQRVFIWSYIQSHCTALYFAPEAEIVIFSQYGGTRQAISQNPGACWTIPQLLRLRLTNVILIKADLFSILLLCHWMQCDLLFIVISLVPSPGLFLTSLFSSFLCPSPPPPLIVFTPFLRFPIMSISFSNAMFQTTRVSSSRWIGDRWCWAAAGPRNSRRTYKWNPEWIAQPSLGNRSKYANGAQKGLELKIIYVRIEKESRAWEWLVSCSLRPALAAEWGVIKKMDCA